MAENLCEKLFAPWVAWPSRGLPGRRHVYCRRRHAGARRWRAWACHPAGTGCGFHTRSDVVLPRYEDVLAGVAAAEEGDGWLAACEAQGRFLALNREFVSALAGQLRSLSSPVVEICAGQGELAAALAAEGIKIIATDSTPLSSSTVIAADAGEALRRYAPATVLGCFVPFDARVDAAVLAAPSVLRYLVLNARLDGQLGDAAIWRNEAWVASPLPTVSRWVICRHDVWLGRGRPILQHGEAWLFTRRRSETHG